MPTHVKILGRADLPWPLLLEADPHAPHVETYLDRSTWLGLHERDTLIGVAALHRRDARTVELMNIAVAPDQRRRGVGMHFMDTLLRVARAMGALRVEVGTGNSSFAELAFYQRAGFRMAAIDRDHFVREYPEPIVENGIVCRDRVVLAVALDEPTYGQANKHGMRVRPVERADHEPMLALWDRSVRATHRFLTGRDVAALRPQVAREFTQPGLQWWVLLDEARIAGFLAWSPATIEGLFIEPALRGMGGGSMLVDLAQTLSPRSPLSVEVNEDNEQAVGFYRALGFAEVARSPTDDAQRPFPVLSMRRAAS